MSEAVVIVGAGHAGGTLAALLRQSAFGGAITLIGDEPSPPYQRPPLSKAYLTGTASFDQIALRPADFYASKAITWIGERKVVRIERERRTIRFDNGDVLPYGQLVLATGMTPIAILVPGSDLRGVQTLRTRSDADALRAHLKPGARLAIIGGGYIGLEVAAAARSLGADVTIIERAPQLLARSASPQISRFLQTFHEGHDVQFHFNATVESLEGHDHRVAALRLAGGHTIPCDAVLVGVGGRPNVSLAQDAGLAVDNGIIVDERCLTGDAFIHAIGDVTNRPIPTHGCRARLESVQNAMEQARCVAHALTGRPIASPEVPWNWSDQYDLKMQFAGLISGSTSIVLRGSSANHAFTVFHLREDRLVAAEAVNAPAEFMAARHLILSAKSVDPTRLTDPAVAPKSFLQ
jgi:3-phenylpropionate/trans-cinnamate dioxygenase ferredoxin reductase subunit